VASVIALTPSIMDYPSHSPPGRHRIDANNHFRFGRIIPQLNLASNWRARCPGAGHGGGAIRSRHDFATASRWRYLVRA
jgi:hypothetical protein